MTIVLTIAALFFGLVSLAAGHAVPVLLALATAWVLCLLAERRVRRIVRLRPAPSGRRPARQRARAVARGSA